MGISQSLSAPGRDGHQSALCRRRVTARKCAPTTRVLPHACALEAPQAPAAAPSSPGVFIPQSATAELPSIRDGANIGLARRMVIRSHFLELLEIEICFDVFVVSQPPVNDPVLLVSLAYKHAPFLKGHD